MIPHADDPIGSRKVWDRLLWSPSVHIDAFARGCALVQSVEALEVPYLKVEKLLTLVLTTAPAVNLWGPPSTRAP